MDKKITRPLNIENARIGFRNFSGKEGRFNPEGKRNFCVFLEEGVADKLKDDGWNIRVLLPKDPQDDPQHYLPVKVAYDFYPPRIFVVTETSKTELTENAIKVLDWAEIESVDLTIRPYNWKLQSSGKSGVTAYVRSMYVRIVEDEFAKKYRNVPDSAVSALEDEPLLEE